MTITIDEETLALAQQRVAEGRASSVSALIAAATRRDLGRESLSDVARDIMAEVGGKPSEEDREWARRALGLSSSTPEP